MVLDEQFEGLDEPGLDLDMQLIRNKAQSLGDDTYTHIRDHETRTDLVC